MKILYFTASGNSLHIAKSMGGDLYSIPKMEKEGIYEFTDDKIGIIFPVHAWGVPSYVAEFLSKATFNCEYLFAISTYGIYSGAVAKHLTDIGNEAGYNFSYINTIKMVDNYIPTFDMKKEVKNEPKKEIEKHLADIKTDVENSIKWILKESILRKMMFNLMSMKSKPFSKKRLKVHIYGEGIENYIYVDESCTGCGTCAKVCPVDNIVVDKENRKIALNDKCFACFSCIHNCPTKSIHINGEVNGNRFRNRHINLKEIVKANN